MDREQADWSIIASNGGILDSFPQQSYDCCFKEASETIGGSSGVPAVPASILMSASLCPARLIIRPIP